MRRPIPARPLLALSLVCLGVIAGTRPASAQRGPQPLSGPQFGIGYVGNAPEAAIGGSAYVIFPAMGGIGLYVDAKFDVSNPTGERGWDPSVTSLDVLGMPESIYLLTQGSWKSFNAAVIRPLNPSFLMYVGGGVAKVRRFDLYNVDPEGSVGLSGVAWVENPETAETRTNLMAGIMMRMSSILTAQFGYETQPKGVTAGLSLRLPRW